MNAIAAIFMKEFRAFFASPAAWLFLGGFLIFSLFIFFWVEAFFARNIADLKPLFQWMPVLLIFLVSALTMRSWSEERRSGTLESLLTSPVTPLQLVLGKFLASWALVGLALLLTLPLPLTVSMMGPLDWGPVMGGYLASLFLAAAYVAIGLYMSARTDNPIVSLILTVAVAGFFFLIGSRVLTNLLGYDIGHLLTLLGTGSRFDSITRGVLDVRDLYYYLSMVGVFLALNLYTLERIRWAGNKKRAHHRQWGWLTILAIINLVLVNLWLNPVGWARLDLTQGKIYSLSDTTRQYVSGLREPLLIRGYFSSKSHPLLEPLTPQIRDLLKEYQVLGGDKVRVEFIDPHTNQALEEEAASKYGIRPVPFRMASRYESGVVNSYFDMVVAYGDQYETLSYNDLIEIKAGSLGEPEVLLKNPEYALTRAIRKITSAYQTEGNVFSQLKQPITFNAYVSEIGRMPQLLAELRSELAVILGRLQQESAGKLTVNFADPDANGGQLGEQLQQTYGFGPQVASLIDPQPFWFYMLLEGEGETVQVPLPPELDKASLEQSIEAAIQRMAPGFLKTVALVVPPQAPQTSPYAPPASKRYQNLRAVLEENIRLKETDLQDGMVPADADLLLLLAPEALDEKQLFAIDQFLMQGGSVVVTTSPFDVEISNTLAATKHVSGLEEWLQHHGLSLKESMVLDVQNAALPIPMARQLGGLSINEIVMMPYPHFPDIRNEGLNADNPMTAGLGQLTVSWASPIEADVEKNKERTVIPLLSSSANSWLSDDLNILPDYEQYPDSGFKRAQDQAMAVQQVAVAVQGRFDSFFKDKASPLLTPLTPSAEGDDNGTENGTENSELLTDESDAEQGITTETAQTEKTVVASTIERSSDSARIVLIGSNAFATDSVTDLASQGQGTLYAQPQLFLQNAVDWSLDDEGLLSIRGRAQFARTLVPMQQSARLFWEYLNYALALLGLALLWGWQRLRRQQKQKQYQQLLAEV